MTMEIVIPDASPESMDFGTIKLPTNPIAYKNEARNTTYASIP